MQWQESLLLQTKTIQNATSHLQNQSLSSLVESLATRSGLIFFTGIGKNGMIAAKLASTYTSLGLRSVYVDPVHAYHGDLGLFSQDDHIIAMSKSGDTEELVRFLSTVHSYGVKNILAVHSRPGCSLGRFAKHELIIPVDHEGDQLNMAPMASTLTYMLVLQAIGVELSSRNSFSKKDFVRTHPGGALGRGSFDD